MSTNKEKITNYLSVLRKKGITYKGIAEHTGINESRIRNITKGVIEKVTDEEIKLIEYRFLGLLQNGSTEIFLPPDIQKQFNELQQKVIEHEELKGQLEDLLNQVIKLREQAKSNEKSSKVIKEEIQELKQLLISYVKEHR